MVSVSPKFTIFFCQYEYRTLTKINFEIRLLPSVLILRNVRVIKTISLRTRTFVLKDWCGENNLSLTNFCTNHMLRGGLGDHFSFRLRWNRSLKLPLKSRVFHDSRSFFFSKRCMGIFPHYSHFIERGDSAGWFLFTVYISRAQR